MEKIIKIETIISSLPNEKNYVEFQTNILLENNIFLSRKKKKSNIFFYYFLMLLNDN